MREPTKAPRTAIEVTIPIWSVHLFHVFCEILPKYVITTAATAAADNNPANIASKFVFLLSFPFIVHLERSRRRVVAQPKDLVDVCLEGQLVVLGQVARVVVGVGELVVLLLEEVAEPLVPALLHELYLLGGPPVECQGPHKTDVDAVAPVLSGAVYAQVDAEGHWRPRWLGSSAFKAFLLWEDVCEKVCFFWVFMFCLFTLLLGSDNSSENISACLMLHFLSMSGVLSSPLFVLSLFSFLFFVFWI